MKTGTLLGVAAAVLTAAAVLIHAHSQGNRRQGVPMDRQGITRVGELAPDFTLKTLDGAEEVTLSSYKGQRPVALIFGSYT